MTGLGGGMVFGLGAGLLFAVATLLGVWGERKVAARLQKRHGPQEAGPFGMFQLVADLLKLLLKEDITPSAADVRVFRIAPLIVFAPAAMSAIVIPFAAGWAPLDANVGMLFFLAVPSLAVFGVLGGGWASANTYATLGGLRAAAQMVSYEVPRTLAVLSIVVLAGTLRPLGIVAAWEWWWLPLTSIGFIVYFASSIAELNRGPFDLPEAESELVAGYFADYSGIRWAIFMMTEYGGLLVASLMGSVLFWGGTNGIPGVLGVLVLVAKAIVWIIAFMWVRWTYPRMRQDQLMSFAWKTLTPLALLQLALVGAVIAWVG